MDVSEFDANEVGDGWDLEWDTDDLSDVEISPNDDGNEANLEQKAPPQDQRAHPTQQVQIETNSATVNTPPKNMLQNFLSVITAPSDDEQPDEYSGKDVQLQQQQEQKQEQDVCDSEHKDEKIISNPVSTNEENVESTLNEQTPTAKSSNENTTPIGSGILMGRLSRFLDAATEPAPAIQDAWGDDDGFGSDFDSDNGKGESVEDNSNMNVKDTEICGEKVDATVISNHETDGWGSDNDIMENINEFMDDDDLVDDYIDEKVNISGIGISEPKPVQYKTDNTPILEEDVKNKSEESKVDKSAVSISSYENTVLIPLGTLGTKVDVDKDTEVDADKVVTAETSDDVFSTAEDKSPIETDAGVGSENNISAGISVKEGSKKDGNLVLNNDVSTNICVETQEGNEEVHDTYVLEGEWKDDDDLDLDEDVPSNRTLPLEPGEINTENSAHFHEDESRHESISQEGFKDDDLNLGEEVSPDAGNATLHGDTNAKEATEINEVELQHESVSEGGWKDDDDDLDLCEDKLSDVLDVVPPDEIKSEEQKQSIEDESHHESIQEGWKDDDIDLVEELSSGVTNLIPSCDSKPKELHHEPVLEGGWKDDNDLDLGEDVPLDVPDVVPSDKIEGEEPKRSNEDGSYHESVHQKDRKGDNLEIGGKLSSDVTNVTPLGESKEGHEEPKQSNIDLLCHDSISEEGWKDDTDFDIGEETSAVVTDVSAPDQNEDKASEPTFINKTEGNQKSDLEEGWNDDATVDIVEEVTDAITNVLPSFENNTEGKNTTVLGNSNVPNSGKISKDVKYRIGLDEDEGWKNDEVDLDKCLDSEIKSAHSIGSNEEYGRENDDHSKHKIDSEVCNQEESTFDLYKRSGKLTTNSTEKKNESRSEKIGSKGDNELNGENTHIITRLTSEGIPVDINYEKLLEKEVLKRLILEKLVEENEAIIEELESDKAAANTAAAEAEHILKEKTTEFGKELSLVKTENLKLISDIGTMSAKFKDLQLENKNMTTDFSTVRKTLADVEEEKNKFSRKLTLHERDMIELQKLVKESNTSKGEVDRLSKEVTTLRYELDDKKVQEDASKIAMKELQCKLDETMKQLNKQKEEGEKIANSNEETIESLRTTVAHLEKELQEGSTKEDEQTITKETTIETLKKQLHESEEALSMLIEESNTAVETKDKDVELLLSSISDFKNHLQKVSSAKEKLGAHFEKDVPTLINHVSQIQDENIICAERHEEALSTLDQVNQEHELTTIKLKQEIATLKDEVYSLENENLKLKGHKETMSSDQNQNGDIHELEYLKAERNLIGDETKKLNEQVVDLQILIIDMKDERKVLQDKLKKEEELAHKLTQETKRYKESLNILENDLKTINEEKDCAELKEIESSKLCAEMEVRIKKMNEKIKSFIDEKESYPHNGNEFGQLHERYTDLVKGKKSLKSEKDNSISELINLESNFDIVYIEYSAIKEELKNVNDSKRLLEEERVSNITQRDQARHECTELRQSLEKSRIAILESSRELDQKNRDVSNLEDTCAQLSALNNKLELERENQIISEEKLREIIESLNQEKEHLELDNDELLVQLGLSRQLQQQEYETYSSSLETFQKEVEKHQVRNTELSVQLKESRKEEEIKNLQMKDKSSQESISELTQLNVMLDEKVSVLNQEMAEKDNKITLLIEEKQQLTERSENMMKDISFFEKSKDAKDGEIKVLGEQCRNLKILCSEHEKDIDRMSILLEDRASSNLEVSKLHEEIKKLTFLHSEQSNLLRERDNRIQSLQHQLESSNKKIDSLEGAIMETTHKTQLEKECQKVEELQRALMSSEQELKASQCQIINLEKSYNEMKTELRSKRDKVASIECALLESQLKLDARENEKSAQDEQVRLIEELEAKLVKKDQEFIDIDMQRRSLMAKLQASEANLAVAREEKQIYSANLEDSSISLQVELTKCKEKINQLTRDISERNDQLHEAKQNAASMKSILTEKEGESEKLKTRVQYLWTELNSMKNELESKMEGNLQAVAEVHGKLAQKEEKLLARETEVEALKVQLQSSQASLKAKEDEASMLTDQLEERKEQVKTTREATAHILGGQLSKEEAESVEFMRKQLISLAVALERAEFQRAEAMERVLRERKSNAESLKKLGESVKRFYSTLICGDST